ncbi:glycoside hydrolase family 55 protein [Rhodocollybia butyracea]|uniref:Glycoside hydrolase family 55 protein n=1 Tax=Rhodocollybia butyracea TaxID=206335 RepID=A0A9P5PSP5_9AGAR|nr:glycoside hydrolase family 55 protein [Rhodocollybia butyracea]
MLSIFWVTFGLLLLTTVPGRAESGGSIVEISMSSNNITASIVLAPTDSLSPTTSHCAYWRELIKHQGTSPFNPNTTYAVYRNVRDYGAKGDGKTDDSAAINLAISDGGRCGGGNCSSSTITPAVVYFPSGTYLVKHAITPYYMTQLLGDPKAPPTLLADKSFHDMAVIDADPYIINGGGAQWFINQDNFYRTVKNFVIDVRRVPANNSQGTGIHWQVAQGTSLQNIVFNMSEDPDTAHQGIWMENGSGGFMGDLVFNGGKFGMWVGNQQFTVRNVIMNNCKTAVFGVWNLSYVILLIIVYKRSGVELGSKDGRFKGLRSTTVGFDLLTGGTTSATQSVGAEAIIDAVVNDTPYFVRSSNSSTHQLSGSLVLVNAKLSNVSVAVGAINQTKPFLAGTPGVMKIAAWGQGNTYKGSNPNFNFTQGNIDIARVSDCLLDAEGRIVSKGRPQYEDYNLDQIVSAKSYGDGETDDTCAFQSLLDECAANNLIVFLDAGVYILKSTLVIPPNTRLTGEAWSVISATGLFFADQENPQVAVRVGEKGSEGIVEITDIVFSTKGPAPGAILVEWNIRDPAGAPASAGMWDSHFRVGGAAGTNMDVKECPAGTVNPKACTATFLSLHITNFATAYLEVGDHLMLFGPLLTQVLSAVNVSLTIFCGWVWIADHGLEYEDQNKQLELYAGRGVLSESQGPVWMIGTAEHHVIYQYRLVNAKDHYLGLVQTETPYHQPIPAVPFPFTLNEAYGDPTFTKNLSSAWALSVERSQGIFVFGAGFYSFFTNYTQNCSTSEGVCQTQIVDIDDESDIQLLSVSTVGAQFLVSVNKKGVARQQDSRNGFADTITAWNPAWSCST